VVDQVYGIEDRIVNNASKRFLSLPKQLQKHMQKTEAKSRKTFVEKKFDFTQMVTEESKEKRIRSKLKKVANDEQVNNQSVDKIIKTYSFYINKILNYKVDPFITVKRQAWTDLINMDKLKKLANVFDRLHPENK
jgi:hypothetical protein